MDVLHSGEALLVQGPPEPSLWAERLLAEAGGLEIGRPGGRHQRARGSHPARASRKMSAG